MEDCAHLQKIVVLQTKRASDLLRDDDRVSKIFVRDVVQLLAVV
jgi:hypothetical protein